MDTLINNIIGIDVTLLARIQFALTIMFHYLFPPITIGLGIFLVYFEGRHYFFNDDSYHKIAKFWTTIFGLTFALGVASGIVMEFQFGTNWAVYSKFVGDVFGSPLAIEGIVAFFLESTFLGVLIFGWDKVSKGMHLFATCMVSLGSILSSLWIVAANSWQQTPTGYKVVPVFKDGVPWLINGEPLMRAEITNFWEMVFNPSFLIRIHHVLIGCFIMGAFVILSICAYYIIKNKHIDFAKKSFLPALVVAFLGSYAALLSGHIHAKQVYKYQPAKLAAFEGHFNTGRGDLTLFGLPDETNMRLKYPVTLPGGLSFLLFENFKDEVLGLDKIKPENRPPVKIPFLMWRTMVGIGMFFIALTSISIFLWWKRKLFNKQIILWLFVISVVPAMVANQSGWIAAEVGRQPWIVYPPIEYAPDGSFVFDENGYLKHKEELGLRTKDAISKNVTKQQVLGSLIGFSLVYFLLFIMWMYLLWHKIVKGPEKL